MATTPTPSSGPRRCATGTAWTPAPTRSRTSRGPGRTAVCSTASSRRSAATATPSPATASRPTDPPFSLNVGGFLHPDGRDAAWAALADGYLLTRRVYGDWYGLDPAEYATWYPDQLTPEQVAQRQSEILLGTPDDIVPVLAAGRATSSATTCT